MVVAFGNATDNNTTAWVAEPNGRGSWDILSSCVITISLCAWTALHLNVPEHKTAKRQWLRKTKWLLLGLAAPETVAYVAWRQRQEAKRVLEDVRKHLGQSAVPSRVRRILHRCRLPLPASSGESDKTASTASSPVAEQIARPNWTLVHGFYAVMGGFSLDSSDASDPFLPDGRTRAAITADGLRFLLEHEPDLLPGITEEQIKDKSKADGLKKTLVCAQALWFCANCITRLANRLPISLLELNAVGHAACALLIYLMWWQKPLDVDEPTLVGGYKAQLLLAYMWMSSGVSAKGYKSQDVYGRLKDEFDALWVFQDPKPEELVFNDCSPQKHLISQQQPATTDQGARCQPTEQSSPTATMPLPIKLDAQSYPRFFRHYSHNTLRFRLTNWLHRKTILWTFGHHFPAGPGTRRTMIDHLSPTPVTRWHLAHAAITRYHLESDLRTRHGDRSGFYNQSSRVRNRVSNPLTLVGSRAREVWAGFAVAGVLYGGLHLLAWDAPFGSRLELVCWRIAASSVVLSPVLLAPIPLLFEQSTWAEGAQVLLRARSAEFVRGNNAKAGRGRYMFWMQIVVAVAMAPLLTVAPLLWFLYVLGRVYLVVECFVNFARLPAGVFEDVGWPGYLPHIS